MLVCFNNICFTEIFNLANSKNFVFVFFHLLYKMDQFDKCVEILQPDYVFTDVEYTYIYHRIKKYIMRHIV